MENVPAAPTEPDPTANNDWDPSPGESITGHVHDRETIETKYGDRVVLSIAAGDGDVIRVPCFRTHLRELLAVNDAQPGDGIAITYFGPDPGKKKELYAMRVDKTARLEQDKPVVEAEEAA
jgi:hypothetical protein